MMIPNYSKPDDWETFNALGVTQYGQMTAGSYMYIGPQGIVHGTTITILNAFRKINKNPEGHLFVTSGLGGMSGAQPKAGSIAGCITVCAEVNLKITKIRHEQGWIDEIITDLNELVKRVKKAKSQKETVSIAYLGNVVDVWETFDKENITIEIGSDQTSLHNPYAGGYYPVGMSFEDANKLMAEDPSLFKEKVQQTLRQHVQAVNKHTEKGTYFFDYGNAFLLESSRAGAEIMAENNIDFKIAKNNERSQELLLKYEKSKSLPSLTAFINGGYIANSDLFAFTNADQKWLGSSLLGVSLNVPIFSSGMRSAKTQRAKIEFEKAAENLTETEQQLKLQIASSKSNYQFAIEEYQNKKENLNLAERIEQKNQTKFFEGISSSFDLRQAQTQLYTAQQQLLQAMLDVINKKADLETVLNTTLN